MNRTHKYSVFNTSIPERNTNEREEVAARYTPTRAFLDDHMQKPQNLKYACYRALLHTWVRWRAAPIRLEGPYFLNLLKPKTDALFHITEKDFSPRTGHSYSKHHREKNPEYFETVGSTKELTSWAVQGSQKYSFYSEEENAKRCKVIKMGDVKLPRKCIFSGHRNGQHAGGGCNVNHC